MPPSVNLTVPITDNVETPLTNNGRLSSVDSSISVVDSLNRCSIVIETTGVPSTFDMRGDRSSVEEREDSGKG